jgi:hypothetical protein
MAGSSAQALVEQASSGESFGRLLTSYLATIVAIFW